MVLAFFAAVVVAESHLVGAAQDVNVLEIREVQIEGKSLRWQPGKELSLGNSPKDLIFGFGPNKQSARAPLRIRYKLDGYDREWHEGGGFMFVMIRFYNEVGDRVMQKMFPVHGSSPGWKGTLEDSEFTHRREALVVPHDATRFCMVISSAGPPSTEGVYLVKDLVVRKSPTNAIAPEVILSVPLDEAAEDGSGIQPPQGWERDGTQTSMAKILVVGRGPKMKAFAIVDDDAQGHAEWHNSKAIAPRVAPDDALTVEWNESYSIGERDNLSAQYSSLPPGPYQFRVAEVAIFGQPTGMEASLAIRVTPPYWQMTWFWATLSAIGVAIAAMVFRYIAWRRMQRRVVALAQEHLLEQERVRIAQDIHDDLGARVTQISLLSGMARQNIAFPETARAEFNNISLVSQELVAALYETVWAVSPENDNLDAMGNYLCQRINELCTQAQLGCRLHVSSLPREIHVSSRIRHNIIMAAKEAVHNVIKHARATEVEVFISYVNALLTVSIQDNGCGFNPCETPSGNGLVNMKRRLESIGGSCVIDAVLGKGAKIQLLLVTGVTSTADSEQSDLNRSDAAVELSRNNE